MAACDGEYLVTRRSVRLCAKRLSNDDVVITHSFAAGPDSKLSQTSKKQKVSPRLDASTHDVSEPSPSTPSRPPSQSLCTLKGGGIGRQKISPHQRPTGGKPVSSSRRSKKSGKDHHGPRDEGYDVADIRTAADDTLGENIDVIRPRKQLPTPLIKRTASGLRTTPTNRKALIVKLRLRNGELKSFPTAPIATVTISDIGLLTPPSSITRYSKPPEVGEELLRVSRSLCRRLPINSKPLPQGQPRVWADSRQALCETLPYFRSMQGGCYHNDRHVYAILRDNLGHGREHMDSDVIVSRVCSGMEVDKNGRLSQTKNHEMNDVRVRAFLNDIQYQNPLVVICGNNCEDAVCQLPHRYCVLGWYKPIAIWAEKTIGSGGIARTTIKYRLERLGCGENAWHSPPDESSPNIKRDDYPMVMKECMACEQQHPQVYLFGWVCLNPTCVEFWSYNGQDASEIPGSFDFHPGFLLHRTLWPNEEAPYDLRPPVYKVGDAVGDHLTYLNTRGICCPRCGRCSSRRLFKGWQCDNPACDFTQFLERFPVSSNALYNPWSFTGEGLALSRNKHSRAGVKLSIDFIEGYKVNRYTFEGVKGTFIHAVSNTKINSLSHGPDHMLQALQVQDFRLERRRFSSTIGKRSSIGNDCSSKSDQPPEERGEQDAVEDGDYMTAFSMNFGMPYKFAANGASASFEEGPETVRICRSLLNHAAQVFVPDSTHGDFNEELIIAYMQGQKMEYHDDGERGLGPRIASISLGGAAKMHLRMKGKHFAGCSKKGILTAERPIACGVNRDTYIRRLCAWEEIEQMMQGDRNDIDKRRRELPQELGLLEHRLKKAEDLITLTLQHGDIVIMDGHDIQTYFEHKVVPCTHLRFGITCRTILAEHLAADERPTYPVEPDGGRWVPLSHTPWCSEPVMEQRAQAANQRDAIGAPSDLTEPHLDCVRADA